MTRMTVSDAVYWQSHERRTRMGEMSEAVIDGACCSWCGVFFEKEHGYPVVCRACWRESTAAERVGVQRATLGKL